MIKFWRLLSVPIVVGVCIGLLLVPGTPPQAAAQANEWGLEIEPAMNAKDFNESFMVNASVVRYDGDSAVYIMYVEFNGTLLNVTGVDIPATLPNGFPPFEPLGPGSGSTWDNTTGWVRTAYTKSPGKPDINLSFTFANIHFTTLGVPGITNLNFSCPDPINCTFVGIGASNYLNWTKVVNGTVKVGLPPTISVSPHNLTFNAIEAGENPPDQTLELCNSGAGTLSWSLTDNAGWLSETPTSGSLGGGECEDVTVSVDVNGMESGDYSAAITITGSLEMAVNLHVESATPVEPVEPANLSASSLSISPQQVEPGQEVTISINVANTGGETGSYNAVLYINGVVEDSQSVSVEPGTSKNVIFTVSKSQAGVYDVSLAGQSGQFEVVNTGWSGGGGLSTGGIIAIVVVVIALIVALVFILRRTRREV